MDNDLLLFCAFRYALGRKTYIVDAVIDEIKNNLSKLNKNSKKAMIREIAEAIASGNAGMSIDVASWEGLLERLKYEIKI